ncbi:MAG: protein BatD [Deltaproteobacteria bacterium]|nr:protein BatD [Deltaproteobacteria bacterium]
MIRLLTLAFFVMAALPWAATAAAEPEVTVTLGAVPAEVRIGEATRLEVRVHARGGSIQNLELSDLEKYPELEIVSHQTIRPMQFSFGFGSGVQKESSLANVYILQPLVAGTYEFAPAVAKVDGKTYRSAPLTLVVLPASGGATGGSAAATDATIESDLSGARYDEHAFLRTVVEPEEVYIGQQVNVTVYLYVRLGLSPQSVVPSKPSMDGFWVHDDPVTSLQSQTVSVMGAHYRAFVLQRSAAFPQRSGELTIGPPKVTFDAGGRSLFDARRRLDRVGVPVTVNVKPLPQPGPPDAVVGPHSIRASLDRTTVRTGDAVTLRVDAGGVGNVQELRVTLPPIVGVRTLQPVIRDQQQFQGAILSGARTWEWILIAETPGVHTVPSIDLHFFDPDTEEYGSASTDALTFTSHGAAKLSQPAIEPVDAGPKPSGAIFGPIRMYSALTRDETPIRDERWFPWLLALPPILFALFILGAGAARRRDQRSATAGAVQRQLLRSAEDALQANDPRSFYDRIVASVTHALDSRLGEPVGGLPHAALRIRLGSEGFDDDLVQRVINELEGADFARFAASGVSQDEMERCRQRTAAVVERIQRSRRKA